MNQIELTMGLLIAAIPLIGIARRWGIPYPVALVVGGLALGFVPGLPRITLDPNLVLLFFLPPLLYWESVTAPTDEMRANGRWIWPLAIGLVLATTAIVAFAAHALVPGMAWATAFVLGAIVAPTDELATVPIAERLGVPRAIVAIIDGESLLNDAASLVLYAVAVAAVVTGTFALPHASFQFVIAGSGGCLIGLAAGFFAVVAWRAFRDTRLQTIVSVLLPFVAYLPAQRFGLSGVLAVVTAGVYVNRYTPEILTPSTRLTVTGWWETTVFLVNAIVYLLVGLTLHSVLDAALLHSTWTQLALVALSVNVVIIGVRFAWIFGQARVPGLRRTSSGNPLDVKGLVVLGFGGLRGAVSLAAALAIPLTTMSGARFPNRELIILTTFSVIVVTLVGGGLGLPAIIGALRIPVDDTEENEVRTGLRALSAAGAARLDQLLADGRVDERGAKVLRERYCDLERLAQPAGDAEERHSRRQ
ncbi:MAG: Na+/H+ antiporter, partial [Candidatus Eremiobacteraeota bacterium]|nr:Na+/H+ antiporter [Candidatus Eremiobacteraeota bacterium]